MDYKIIRLNSNDADIVSTDKKNYTFFLKKPIVLNDELIIFGGDRHQMSFNDIY